MTATPNWDVLRELKALLDARSDPLVGELQGLWSRYAAGEAEPRPEGFLDLLRSEQRIDAFTHARLAARASIDLSAPGTARFDIAARIAAEQAQTITDSGRAVDAPRKEPGPVGPRYALLGPLGEGGMGVVRAARDTTLHRQVALKTLLHDDPDSLARFVREAQLTAQLDHPYVVPIYALEADEGGVSYAMKLVRGRDLATVIARARAAELAGEPAPEEVGLQARLEAFLKACDAMAFAHERGVIHRDLKPANIMIGPYHETYVLDWGLARVLEGAHADAAEGDLAAADVRQRLEGLDHRPVETLDGEVAGTPAYMSPEQAQGERAKVGPRSDQFALGLILHELVTLDPAYPGKHVLEVLLRAQARRIEPPRRAPHPELAAIVARATAEDPAARYGSVTELADDLRRHLRGVETRALPDGPRQRLYRWMRGHQTAVLLAGVALVLLGAAALGLSRLHHMRELKRRERAIGRLLQEVDGQATRLSSWITHFQGLTESLAGAATHALLNPPPASPQPRYGIDEFADPARRPPDMAPAAARYGREVSTAHPLAHVAPREGAARARAELDVQRLLGLTDQVRTLFLVPEPGKKRRPAGAALDEWIRAHGSYVHWVYVTSQSGAVVIYPGAESGWTRDYDPTQRPWYRDALAAWRERGVPQFWTDPYRDKMSKTRVVTSVHVCLDAQGEPLGTAAVDFLLDDLHDGLWIDRPAWLEEAFLVDPSEGQPRLLLRTNQKADPTAVGEQVDLGTFPYPDALARLQARGSGVERTEDGKLVAWRGIPAVGFALVAVVEAEGFLAGQ
ncbi:MAG: serine/threonine protein kinase [Planctomycetota bacterium]